MTPVPKLSPSGAACRRCRRWETSFLRPFDPSYLDGTPVTQFSPMPVLARRRTSRIAPRWVRSAPKSRSTSPASGSSRRSATSPRRPSFTDHFLSDFHLTRIESTGVGAGARFRVQAPLRSVWMDTTIVEQEEPFRIVEHGQGGRANRIRDQHGLGADRGPRLADHGPLLPLDRADQPPRPGSGGRSAPAPSGRSAAGARRCAAPRRARVRASGRRADRRRGGQPLRDRHPWLNRLSPPMVLNRRFVLPLLRRPGSRPCSRSGSPPAATRATPRTSSRASRSKLGELAVQRRLLALPQPERQRGLRLPRRPAGAAERLHLLRRLLRSPERKRRPADAALDADDHRRRRTNLRRDRRAKASTRFPFGGEVESQEQIPVLDSTPQQGPIEGSVVLFLLPAAASDNRPLTLHIPGPDGEDGEVTLDL